MTRLAFASLAATLLISATPAFAISSIDMPVLTYPSSPVETSKDCANPLRLTLGCPATTTGN